MLRTRRLALGLVLQFEMLVQRSFGTVWRLPVGLRAGRALEMPRDLSRHPPTTLLTVLPMAAVLVGAAALQQFGLERYTLLR